MARKETFEVTCSVSSAIQDGMTNLIELRDEASEIVDGAAGTGREHTGFVQAMAENVDHLEFSEIDVVSEMDELECVCAQFLPKRSWGKTHMSRARRCANALNMLEAAMDVLQREADASEDDDAHLFEDEIAALSELIDQASSCDWPSMRG